MCTAIRKGGRAPPPQTGGRTDLAPPTRQSEEEAKQNVYQDETFKTEVNDAAALVKAVRGALAGTLAVAGASWSDPDVSTHI